VEGFFQPLSNIPVETSAQSYTRPDSYTPFNIDVSDLETALRGAPMEFTAAAKSDPLVLSLPRPDGTLERFEIVESPIMEPGLAAELPGVKTFAGQGVDDPYASVRLDYTPLGFHAQVLSPHGRYYIDPYYHLQASGAYFSYFARDLAGSQSFT